MKRIYFGGGAWSSAFIIGVVKALEEKYGKDLYKKFVFSGDSIGAYVALLCTLGYTSDIGKKIYIELANNANKDGIFNFCNNSNYHTKMFNDIIIDENTFKILEDRKFKIGVSRLYNNHKIYDKWDNNDHLIKTLHASLHIPFYCKYQHYLDNNISFDGGIFLNNELLDDCFLIVGRGDYYDISMNPSLFEILYPPDIKSIDSWVLKGYNKAISFDFENIDKKKRKRFSNLFIHNPISSSIIHFLVFAEVFIYKIVNLF